ncbi:MAG TPA: hypothetical protein VH257_21375 [Chloroflexota bacterium]|nr:hypothetical protein [Chloroflexota bacterium]
MKREFVINRNGKDYVLYAGLLDQAHQQGLKEIKTQLLQAPSSENGQIAICLAEVTTERGTFTGIGDADPGNVSRMMVTALIRMAETRAKARALRDAVNVGMVALEELAEISGDGAPDEAPTRAEGSPSRHGGEIVAFPGSRGAGAAAGTGGPESGPGGRAMPAPPLAPAAGGGGAAGASGEGPGAPGRPGAARPAAARQTDAAPLPPTQTQLETIAKLARSTGRTVSTENLTRAAASDLITRLSEERYGARRST